MKFLKSKEELERDRQELEREKCREEDIKLSESRRKIQLRKAYSDKIQELCREFAVRAREIEDLPVGFAYESREKKGFFSTGFEGRYAPHFWAFFIFSPRFFHFSKSNAFSRVIGISVSGGLMLRETGSDCEGASYILQESNILGDYKHNIFRKSIATIEFELEKEFAELMNAANRTLSATAAEKTTALTTGISSEHPGLCLRGCAGNEYLTGKLNQTTSWKPSKYPYDTMMPRHW